MYVFIYPTPQVLPYPMQKHTYIEREVYDYDIVQKRVISFFFISNSFTSRLILNTI